VGGSGYLLRLLRFGWGGGAGLLGGLMLGSGRQYEYRILFTTFKRGNEMIQERLNLLGCQSFGSG
jgi:hypothetical protein